KTARNFSRKPQITISFVSPPPSGSATTPPLRPRPNPVVPFSLPPNKISPLMEQFGEAGVHTSGVCTGLWLRRSPHPESKYLPMRAHLEGGMDHAKVVDDRHGDRGDRRPEQCGVRSRPARRLRRRASGDKRKCPERAEAHGRPSQEGQGSDR